MKEEIIDDVEAKRKCLLVIWNILPIWSVRDQDGKFGICRSNWSVDIASDWEIAGFERDRNVLFENEAVLLVFSDLVEVSDLVCCHDDAGILITCKERGKVVFVI